MHLAALAFLLAAPPSPPPETPKRPVADTYHGAVVTDPYRWLEDGKDPEVKAWSAAQDARTRAWLGAFPGREALEGRVRELVSATSGRYGAVKKRGAVLFAVKFQPPKQQPFLVALDSPDDLASERVLVDPVALDPSGATAIDFYEPSRDGKLVAVSLSQKGTEDGTLHVVEVATGRELPDRIPRVNFGTAGGSVAWNADGSGFFYTRYPRPGERPEADLAFYQQVWFHRLGTPMAEDAYELGRDTEDARIAENFLSSSDDGRFVLCAVQRGDGGEYSFYLRGPSGSWTRIASRQDRIVKARFGLDGALWLLSRKSAPRGRILRMPLETPELAKAAVVAEAAEGAIEAFEVTRSRLYVADIEGGPSRVRVLDLAGRPRGTLPTPPVSAVGSLDRVGPGEVLYAVDGYLEPRAFYLAEDATGSARKTALSSASPVDFSDAEVVRDFAVSRDGTRIPLSIVQKKGTRRDGRNPTILYGYGGYGISQVPYYNPIRRLWLDQGGVFAVAHVRGGGEYGEEWHLAGNLTRKQNVFDDLAAAARRLFERKVTSPEKLALMGGSNGGLLMGAMVTQHPALARAVVAMVGIFDMLRVELHPNGAFNVTEFGSVRDPAQFRALRAYSPFHNVKNGTRYPAVLLTAGERDPRVDAYHARKMAARLQAATASKRPVLLRVSDLGHGIGSALDARIAETADVYGFLFAELGLRFPPPERSARGAAGAGGAVTAPGRAAGR